MDPRARAGRMPPGREEAAMARYRFDGRRRWRRRRWSGVVLVVALGAGLAPEAGAGPLIREFTAGLTAGSGPTGITAGPDRNLWFTEQNGSRIGRITPAAASPRLSSASSRPAVSCPSGIRPAARPLCPELARSVPRLLADRIHHARERIGPDARPRLGPALATHTLQGGA